MSSKVLFNPDSKKKIVTKGKMKKEFLSAELFPESLAIQTTNHVFPKALFEGNFLISVLISSSEIDRLKKVGPFAKGG